MSLWAEVEGNKIVRYPLGDAQVRAETRANVTLPGLLDGLGVIVVDGGPTFVEVPYLEPPKAKTAGNIVVLGDPTWEGDALARTFEERAPTEDELTAQWKKVRRERGRRLRLTDWTQASDVKLPKARATAVLAYRQALRDITKQANPFAITWPTPPA